MSKPLVVVESPTKIRTLQKYLGKDYNISATVGHIKDLPEDEMGIDIENGFKPKYRNIPGKQKVISELKRAAGEANDIYLAPDPDREGEAIAWHTADVLKKKGRNFYRVLFHELTESAIRKAMENPENLHAQKYEAQQARRILDRLVGYEISPLLWKKVKRGLSAGRVQSVAVRIICERERAIQVFVPEEYWSITAFLITHPPLFEKERVSLRVESGCEFTAKLVKKDGKKIHLSNESSAKAVLNEISGADLIVKDINKKTIKRNPSPPFTTSKLQQEAIRRLGFSAKKTMSVAQQLYEGIELGPGESIGLITYMRTDSTRIAQEAAEEAIRLIKERFGDNYAIQSPRVFKNRKKVQDAHEAIRPTSVYHIPEEIAPYLNADQMALYSLIWKRFVASQMQQALIDNQTVSIGAGRYIFTASGSIVKFPGFMALYMSYDDVESDKKQEQLPELSEGIILKLDRYEPKQHFTMPPPRFSEASLVKELEENGIGRPSTYATILSTIRDKGYVDFNKGHFIPTELGIIVNSLIVENFPDIVDVDFTAKMEDDLDRVETAEIDALNVLNRFYEPFKKELETADKQMLSVKAVGIPTELNCPECGRAIHIKVGKNGHFLSCSGYPECTWSRNYIRDEKGKIQPVEPVKAELVDKTCEKCGKPMVLKQGRYGTFLACSGYPDCKNTQSANSEINGEKIGVKCPEQGCIGNIVQKKSKRGKIFYGCNQYPNCKFAIWDKPVDKKCPNCGAEFLVEKSTKKKGTFLACINQDCGFEETLSTNQDSTNGDQE